MSKLTQETYASFWEHAEELRKVFVRTAVVIVIGLTVALFQYEKIITSLTVPFYHHSDLTHQIIEHERITNPSSTPVLYHLKPHTSITKLSYAEQTGPGTFLIAPSGYLEIETVRAKESLLIFGPIEGVMIILKVCLWIALLGTAPIWLFFITKFISPALHHTVRRMMVVFLFLSCAFIALGSLFAFFVTIPLANSYLLNFSAGLGTNYWGLSQYLDYTLFLLLGSGFSFELLLILLLLVHIGYVTSDMMIKKRRHVCVGTLILGALLTPPDIVTQLLLALPMLLFYEIAITYARCRAAWVWRKRQMQAVLPLK